MLELSVFDPTKNFFGSRTHFCVLNRIWIPTRLHFDQSKVYPQRLKLKKELHFDPDRYFFQYFYLRADESFWALHPIPTELKFVV
mmetsp:Transcript_11630/g.16137  ORF Transcript_11630/g.16137 Transcript_11630/m.16137 type:complete len:85 (-) Transcript_11630:1407-1661(-)